MFYVPMPEHIKICGATKFGGSFHGRGPMNIGLRKSVMRDRSVTLAISYNLPFAKVDQVHRNKKDVCKKGLDKQEAKRVSLHVSNQRKYRQEAQLSPRDGAMRRVS